MIMSDAPVPVNSVAVDSTQCSVPLKSSSAAPLVVDLTSVISAGKVAQVVATVTAASASTRPKPYL